MGYSDEGDRPKISADIRRRVLVEAGHRCAIPTCRYIETDIHHIVPWATCQKHEYENLIALCPNCHRRADRGEIDRISLRMYKANLRLLHDRFNQGEIDYLFDLQKIPANQCLPWPRSVLILIRRIIEAELVIEVDPHAGVPMGVFHGGMEAGPAYFIISSKGRDYLSDLGLREL